MNFNQLVKELLGPLLDEFELILKNEIQGSLKYENSILILSFSYDFRRSSEVDVTFIFKKTDEFFSYYELREIMSGEKNTYQAVQVVSDDYMRVWIEEVRAFLARNLKQILENHVEINSQLHSLAEIRADEYARATENRFMNEGVEKFWRLKDYSKLVEFLKKYEGKMPDIVKKKYDYALKAIAQSGASE